VQSVLSFDVSSFDAVPHVAEFVADRYFATLPRGCGTIPVSSDAAEQPAQQAVAIVKPLAAATASSSTLHSAALSLKLPPSTPMLAPTPQRRCARGRRPSLPLVPVPMQGQQSSSSKAKHEQAARPVTLASSASSAATPRRAAAASLAAARLLRGGSCSGSSSSGSSAASSGSLRPRRSSSSSLEVQEPLDIADVEYASHACGALARWVSELLREFFMLRSLRALSRAAKQRLDVARSAKCEAEEARRRSEEELHKLSEYLEMWRLRLEKLRAEEKEATRARQGLGRLRNLETRYGHQQPGSGFRSSSSEAMLGPTLPDEPSRAPPKRSVTIAELAELRATTRVRKRQTQRKYLHVMSSPALTCISPTPDEI